MELLKKAFPSIGKFSLWAAGISLGLLANQIANDIPQIITIVSLILFSVLGGVHAYTSAKGIEPNIKTIPLNDEPSQKKEARKGLIVFLSLYKNFIPGNKFSTEELQKIIKEKDYKTLDLADTSATNFGHAINAIKAHKSKLEHLWIVTSKAPLQANAVTSLEYLPVFQEYIEKEIDGAKKIKPHFGKNYSIDITETSNITQRTFELIRDIYKEAKNDFNLNPNDLIVDVTGGFVFMSVGAVLASLTKEQDIEVIGSEYDKVTGNPIGGDKSYPVKIGYAPQISKG